MPTNLNISNDCKIYCFDYYDTIVSRNVEPEYVKKIWCKELKENFSIAQSVEEIYKIRNEKEAFLCEQNRQAGWDLEFKYQTLMDVLYPVLFPAGEVDAEYFSQVATDLELTIEKRVQTLCEDVVSEIRRLKGLGKKIVCISDFYTPSSFLNDLMEYHGIRELFDVLYVSSDELITKRSGRLYDFVLEKLDAAAEEIFMVGDNQWSDYEMPIQKNMKALWLDREAKKQSYQSFLTTHSRNGYVTDELDKIYRACARDKYEDLAFSLYHFTDKLYSKMKTAGIKDVFFLSREGEFLKKIFDYYQDNRMANSKMRIRTHYLMVSRKATFIASLKPLQEESFEMIFRQYVNISLYDFFSSLGFDEATQKKIGERLGVDVMEKQVDLPRTELYQRLLQDEYFREVYEQLRTEQKQNFTEYLNSFGVDFEKEGMCVVDVGWKGTIQDNIFLFFEEKVRITGLYLGLVAPGKEHPNNIKEGLLFTSIPYPQKYFYVFDENKSVFEVMLGASHGSADHYEKTAQGIKVATAEKQEERELFNNMISPMQQGIFKRITEIDEVLVNHSFNKEEMQDFAVQAHAKLVFLPCKEQIDLFYHIYHYENFGVFEFTKFKTKDSISLADRVRSFKRMLTQRRVFFQSSFWGVVALKDAGLGCLVRPYGWYMYNKCYRKEK